jgi:hypothetical protein
MVLFLGLPFGPKLAANGKWVFATYREVFRGGQEPDILDAIRQNSGVLFVFGNRGPIRTCHPPRPGDEPAIVKARMSSSFGRVDVLSSHWTIDPRYRYDRSQKEEKKSGSHSLPVSGGAQSTREKHQGSTKTNIVVRYCAKPAKHEIRLSCFFPNQMNASVSEMCWSWIVSGIERLYAIETSRAGKKSCHQGQSSAERGSQQPTCQHQTNWRKPYALLGPSDRPATARREPPIRT